MKNVRVKFYIDVNLERAFYGDAYNRIKAT
jgi:hypothetical protein